MSWSAARRITSSRSGRRWPSSASSGTSTGVRLPVYAGMRNWHPFLQRVVWCMNNARRRRAVGVILAAHRSNTSLERYRLDVSRAIDANGRGPRSSICGDTVTTARHGATQPLTGYREPRPMVYSGLYPVDGSDYPDLRDALDKLQLNDAALTYEPETSVALGFGFRSGFLGLLHMEITRERLEREFDLDLISTSPNVVYRVVEEDGTEKVVTNPSDWPDGKIRTVYEPVVKTTIIAPSEFIGTIMELCQSRRGELGGMDYLSPERVELRYTMPLGEIIFDFFDALKSRTRGYASLDYEEAGEQEADLVKVDILLQGEAVDAFSAIVHKESAFAYGNKMTTKLKELIPRQQFEVPVQAAIGSKIIARENIRAIRKDVLSKCYGGDITRKRKLLEKQKEGKKRMKTIGRVEVPQEAFVAALSTDAAGADRAKK